MGSRKRRAQPVAYKVVLTSHAKGMLEAIKDRRIREKIRESIDGLSQEPEKKGKPLIGPLAGYRSLRAVGQRYRIIYRVEEEKVLVIIIAIGIRKERSREDIYALARKLISLRLL